MSKITWIVEHFGLNKGEDDLRAEIVRQGHTLINAAGKEIMYGDAIIPKVDGPVVVMGSIQFCGYVLHKRPDLASGVCMTMPNYECTVYYPHFGQDLLNSEYCMLPFGELNRRKEWLFDKFGVDRTVFIRPNSGNKVFTGQLVYKENWNKDIERIGFYDVAPCELCVVARPKPLGEESRFVVVKGKVISGSVYRDVNNIFLSGEVEPANPDSVLWHQAQYFVNKTTYNPDHAWVIDLAWDREDEVYKVLEVGAFSCCGIYGCQVEPIITEVSRVIEKNYESELFGA